MRCCFASALMVLQAALLAGIAPAQQESTQQESAQPETVAADPAEDASPATRFAAVHREWTALDKRLNELQQTYAATTAPAAREEIKKQYEELVGRSSELLPQLRTAAIAAYEAAPNQNADVLRTLIGVVAYEFRRDDYEAALELARTLEGHGCTEAVLYAVAGAAAYNADDYDTAEKWLKIANEAGKLDANGKEMLAELPEQRRKWQAEQAIRTKEAEADDLPRIKLTTSKGEIVVELFENEAPQTVGNFVSLVESEFYDGVVFHRVLPGFMAQGGDPTGTGSGGPGYHIYCECNRDDARNHFRGTLSMAHAGPDTGGSQFFLTFRPTTHLNGRHTAFGRVIEGHDVLAKIQRRDPNSASPPQADKIITAKVLRKRDHMYQPTKVEP
jgi:cyclophilin family peptidyl-prolyl cis-trans isomerase